MTNKLKDVIESVLEDVHIETGRTDEWERVVNDLVEAIKREVLSDETNKDN